jgi:UTP--glucose-1-phosphate uridylyltransferase
MLPLVDKPIIQYGVEEAVAAGIEHVVLVAGQGKSAIEDHFAVDTKLQRLLKARGRTDLLAEIQSLPRPTSVTTVQQGEPLGLGHAVLVARKLVSDEAFAVVLSDDVIDANPPALRQLISVYEKLGDPVVAVERMPADQINNYGVVSAEPVADEDGVYRIRGMVEKPSKEDAPSDLAIIGRYILTPDIFPILDSITCNAGDEIQLTDGLQRLLAHRPIYACEIDGVRHDTGSKIGFLRATANFALKRPDLSEAFREYLRTLGAATPTGD